jgi:hypothetical protein
MEKTSIHTDGKDKESRFQGFDAPPLIYLKRLPGNPGGEKLS